MFCGIGSFFLISRIGRPLYCYWNIKRLAVALFFHSMGWHLEAFQLLREIRDNTLLQTNSGSSFMISFNAIYYSFGPTVADLERQDPIFKESVKVVITPMISTLSILNYVNTNSEQVLGYGIGDYFA